jgi:hypothetical protein
MPDYCIDIFSDSLCNYAFLKYNRELINSNQLQFNSLETNEEKFKFLEILWESNLNIKLFPKFPNMWEQIKFDSEKEKILFLLKWQ